MTADNNLELFRNFTDDIWNNHNPDNVDQYFSDRYDGTTPTGRHRSADDYRRFATLFQNAFPDIRVTLNELTADDDGVAAYYTVDGTHTGDFGSLEATDQRVEMEGCVLRRVENGRFVQGWHQFDMLSMMIQLGVMEVPDYLMETEPAEVPTPETMETGRSPGGAEGKNVIRDFVDNIWNAKNLDQLPHFVSEDYVEHNPMGDFEGIDTFRHQFVSLTLGGFPDFQARMLGPIIGTDELAACSYSMQGTHSGEFGMLDPTNNSVELGGCYVCRIEDGKIVEAWNQFDLLSFNTQLDVVEPPAFLLQMQQEGEKRTPSPPASKKSDEPRTGGPRM